MLFDDKFVDYKVSTKHMRLRTVLFGLVLILAIGSITYGVAKISEKKEGYYVISELASQDAVSYGKGVELHCYLEGSSSNIKYMNREICAAYSEALQRFYKELDADNTYVGYVNIATINEKRGEYVNVSPALYNILLDAYMKTMDGKGYSIFAGALYDHWQRLLVLYDYENFDPLVNKDEAERIRTLSKLINDNDNFKLDFNDEDKSVRLTVSKEYEEYINSNEESNKVLDLNLLHDAYELDAVADILADKAITRGYLVADSGLTMSLVGQDNVEYPVYAIEDEKVYIADIVAYEPGSVSSCFRNFKLKEEEMFFNSITVDGKKYFRNPYINISEQGFNNLYNSSTVIVDKLDAVTASYANIQMINAADKYELDEIIDSIKEESKFKETKIEILVY